MTKEKLIYRCKYCFTTATLEPLDNNICGLHGYPVTRIQTIAEYQAEIKEKGKDQ